MNRILHHLSQAFQAMPASLPARNMADLLITLLFLKVASEYWQTESVAMRQANQSREAFDHAMRLHAPVLMNEQCLFDVCLAADPAQCGATVRHVLTLLEAIQPDTRLNEVLQPQRFGYLDGYMQATQARNPLSDALLHLSHIRMAEVVPVLAPSLALGNAFAAAMVSLYCGPGSAIRDCTQWLATILNPVPGETVFDPACEQGHLLLACANELHLRHPGKQLALSGLEGDQRKWAMTTMLMQLSGLSSRIDHQEALKTAIPYQTRRQLAPADIVLTMIPDKRYPWSHALARAEMQSRFPLRPPIDNRLALFWHALASMKADTGRMGVLISPESLSGHEGAALIRYLVEHNLLDAVINLPLPARAEHGPLPLALILRQQRRDARIAVISRHGAGLQGDLPAGPYQGSQIVAAYGSHQQGAYHPYLRNIEPATLASHQYELGGLSRFGEQPFPACPASEH